MMGPDGKPLTFVFRGGSTLIVDPEAGVVTYSVGEEHLERRGGKARHMAFLRDEIAQQGEHGRRPLRLDERHRKAAAKAGTVCAGPLRRVHYAQGY